MSRNINAAREQLIRDYFSMWLTRKGEGLGEIFSGDAVYVESTGTEYRGARQIEKWFADWFANGEVIRWDISRISHSGQKAFAEWYFECVCFGDHSAFDGVSIVEFDPDEKICSLREFAAEHQHTLPYGE